MVNDFLKKNIIRNIYVLAYFHWFSNVFLYSQRFSLVLNCSTRLQLTPHRFPATLFSNFLKRVSQLFRCAHVQRCSFIPACSHIILHVSSHSFIDPEVSQRLSHLLIELQLFLSRCTCHEWLPRVILFRRSSL